jgi:hypothetical protein
VGLVGIAFDLRVGKIIDADGAGLLSTAKCWTMYDAQDANADLDGAGVVRSRSLHGPAVDMLLGRLDADTTSTWDLPDRLGSTRVLGRFWSPVTQEDDWPAPFRPVRSPDRTIKRLPGHGSQSQTRCNCASEFGTAVPSPS